MAETTCPVFRPTEEEFKSFRRYMEEVVDPSAGKVGLCKIIPPPGWAARRREAAEELYKSVYIPAPIRQCISSSRSNGVYSVHVIENPPMTLAEFKEYADKRAPFPSSTASAGFPGAEAVGVRRGRSSGGSSHRQGGDQSSGRGGSGGYGGGYGVGYGGGYGVGANEGGGGAEESEVARRVRMFWRSLGPNSEAPLYGADTLGTLFAEDDDDSWNVGKLDTILQLLKSNLPGITTSMLYAGMWRSMFAFHVEDVNLYSINYLHRGDPKSWYCVPPDSKLRFESLAQAFFAEEFRACKDHLRHKTTMISPLQIQKAGIAYCTAVQMAGEFMITFPAAYHGGFNHGFNLAESTNFAIDRWIEEGRAAGYCRCSPHSVRIDVDRFEALVRQHRRIAGRESTCLNGLAEVDNHSGGGRRGGGGFRRRFVSKPAEEEEIDVEKDEEDEEDMDVDVFQEWDDEEEEDVQVFHCVCSINTRVVRHVRRRKRDGTFVPVSPPTSASAKASSTPWPEVNTSECPRCGVWGHTACLEYVLPSQFVSPLGIPRAAAVEVEALSAGREVGADAGVSLIAHGAKKRQGPKSGAEEDKAQEGVLSGDATDSAAGPAGAAFVSASASAVLPPPSPSPPSPLSRAVCWRCTQEKAEIVAAASRGEGMVATAPPRRAGKVSGGSSIPGGGGGGGGGVGASPYSTRPSDAAGGAVGRKKKKGVKKARLPNGTEGGESSATGDPGGESVVGEAHRSEAPSAVIVQKRARVGPRLMGKEVLVSDGVAAVLTGVVSAIEDGQARIHYRGRKAKLDEWIDIHSERFLSASEAKKQLKLAKLAMNPSPAADSAGETSFPPSAVGKKSKTSANGSAAADGSALACGGASGRKRVKLGKGGDALGDKKRSDRFASSKRKKMAGGGETSAEGEKRIATCEGKKLADHGPPSKKTKTSGKIDREAPRSRRVTTGEGLREGVEDDGDAEVVDVGVEKSEGRASAKRGKGTPGGSGAVENTAIKGKGKSKGKGKKRGKGRPAGVKPVAIPPRPVVLRKEIPGHHVISNRRAAVLARAHAKEEEEARRNYEKEVAAAERSRLTREQRLKSSLRREQRVKAPAASSSPAGATSSPITTVPARSGSLSQASVEAFVELSADQCEEQWPCLGFGGKPWGLGPFCKELAAPAVREDVNPYSDEERENCASDSEEEAAVPRLPKPPLFRVEMMHRAKVEAGETVDLGEEEGFRAWLAKLRAIQEIPIGHVERCSRALAVALGTAPADGSVRSSLQALLVAETLRGGASQDVAGMVRSVVGTIGDAASKARPSPVLSPSPKGAGRDDARDSCCSGGGSGLGELSDDGRRTDTPDCAVGGVSASGASRDGMGLREEEEKEEEGSGRDPSMIAIRDMEGVASYAHALAYIARSANKQQRAWEEHTLIHAEALAAQESRKSRRSKKKGRKETGWMTWHREGEGQVQSLPPPPSKLRPPPKVVGELKGSFPFCRSGQSLLMHARAMVGLRRARRWAEAWLALPGKLSPTGGVSKMEEAEPGVWDVQDSGEKSLYSKDAAQAASVAPLAGAQNVSVSGWPSQTNQAARVSSEMKVPSKPGWSTETGPPFASISNPWNPREARAATAAAFVPGGSGPTAPVAPTMSSLPNGFPSFIPPWGLNNALALPPLGAIGSPPNPAVAAAAAAAANAMAAALRFPVNQAGLGIPPSPWGLFPFLGGATPAVDFGGFAPLTETRSAAPVTLPVLSGSSELETPVAASMSGYSNGGNDSTDGGVDLLELWRREGAGAGGDRGEETASDEGDEDLVVVDV